MKRLIIDLDDTLSITKDSDYKNAKPRQDVIKKLVEYHEAGFEIAINTSRNMRTYNDNRGKITANTLPIIFEWLKKYAVPYDEIYIGKPWCGIEGFYVDDKAVRPSEFTSMSYDEIKQLLKKENPKR